MYTPPFTRYLLERLLSGSTCAKVNSRLRQRKSELAARLCVPPTCSSTSFHSLATPRCCCISSATSQQRCCFRRAIDDDSRRSGGLTVVVVVVERLLIAYVSLRCQGRSEGRRCLYTLDQARRSDLKSWMVSVRKQEGRRVRASMQAERAESEMGRLRRDVRECNARSFATCLSSTIIKSGRHANAGAGQYTHHPSAVAHRSPSTAAAEGK